MLDNQIFILKAGVIMAFDVEPTSERWTEIASIQDEIKQSRELRRYVYDLENKIHSYESKIAKYEKENKKYKKEILSLEIVQNAIEEEKKNCNSDWSGFQEGF